jgi:ornithine cyclodeaminase/alanine dehydrogenase-like protein (mu-crystallin family)
MTTNVTRVALAGFGAWGQMHARALSAIADAEIVALYCHGENSARAAAEKLPDVPRYTDYDAMLAAMISSHWSSVRPSGFSRNTLAPASSAAVAKRL